MSLRCRTSGQWLHLVIIAGVLLVTWDDQPDVAMHQNLHTLSTARGQLAQGPFNPIMATAPLDLLHVDFTSIETTLEPNQSPRVANVLVFQDHFMKHVLAYVTLTKPQKLLLNFYTEVASPSLEPWPGSWVTGVLTSWVVWLTKCARSLAWRSCRPCPTTHRLMGQWRDSHQTIMQIIGKLGEDKKANWASHLAEIVHAYNGTHTAVTGYSLHYLMFGWRPRPPVDFYFPTIGEWERPPPSVWMNT